MVVAAVLLYTIIYTTVTKSDQNNNSTAVVEINKTNAGLIEGEKSQDSVIITDENTKNNSLESTDTQPDNKNTQASSDNYGLSTDPGRLNVQVAVSAVRWIYTDFLIKMQPVSVENRQAVADQYIANNSLLFSPNYNYLDSGSIHLIPQAYNIAIPESIRINPAIIDPTDPTQVIVQVFLEPDTSWSILVFTKMKQDGSFGSFEKLMPRMNQNPL